MKMGITPESILAQAAAPSGLVSDPLNDPKKTFVQADNGLYNAIDGSSIVYLSSEGESLGRWHEFDANGRDFRALDTLEEFTEDYRYEFQQNPGVKVVVPLDYHPDFPPETTVKVAGAGMIFLLDDKGVYRSADRLWSIIYLKSDEEDSLGDWCLFNDKLEVVLMEHGDMDFETTYGYKFEPAKPDKPSVFSKHPDEIDVGGAGDTSYALPA